jgi:hypothetical protein
VKNDVYDALEAAVTATGFFTTGFEDHGSWHRTCIASKRCPGGVTGTSF